MPFNVYDIREDGGRDNVFYIDLTTITKEGEVESTGWTHSFESDRKDGNQYTARLHSTLRSYPIGHAIATIEEADLPKFHELCFAAIGPVPHKKYPSPPGRSHHDAFAMEARATAVVEIGPRQLL